MRDRTSPTLYLHSATQNATPMKNLIVKACLLVVCASLLLIEGCDKNDPVPPGLKCFLKTATYTSEGDGFDFEVSYGSDGKVTGFEVHESDGQGNYTTTLTATYDGNGRISHFDIDGDLFAEFTYDANGRVTREDDYFD